MVPVTIVTHDRHERVVGAARSCDGVTVVTIVSSFFAMKNEKREAVKRRVRGRARRRDPRERGSTGTLERRDRSQVPPPCGSVFNRHNRPTVTTSLDVRRWSVTIRNRTVTRGTRPSHQVRSAAPLLGGGAKQGPRPPDPSPVIRSTISGSRLSLYGSGTPRRLGEGSAKTADQRREAVWRPSPRTFAPFRTLVLGFLRSRERLRSLLRTRFLGTKGCKGTPRVMPRPQIRA